MDWKDYIYMALFIVYIITLVLTFLRLKFNNKELEIRIKELNLKLEERTAPYRQALYMKQLDGYVELIESMIKIEYQVVRSKTYVLDLIKSLSVNLKQRKEEENQKLIKNKNEFTDKVDKWAIFLPKEIRYIYVEFYETINMDIEDINTKKLREIRIKIYGVAYKKFGIESISEKFKKLIEKPS